ncbi:alkylation response protein AidB-like acyl-CoA dehydrogenase [Pedobacter sp. CG_S7]|uniref:acyl-CoA dehydrogenase n=1 Tax=Pedobacter sp. CG_S7 TaxID=3143930 RepID=UPI003391D720
MQNILSSTLKESIRAYAAPSEELGELHPGLLKLAYDNDWFKLFVPEIYGGPGLMLPEILRLEEALAAEDGSLGWTVTLCSGAGWFAGFLDPELAKTVFSDRKVCFAGSGAVGGIAVKTGESYLINGTWNYASGAAHATVFTANCILQDVDGLEILDEQGNAQVKSFILKREEVDIISGWSYFGLVATGSHAFKVAALKVPLNRTFEINKDIKVEKLGFDYPFLQLAETTLAVNSLGMAQHFIRLANRSFKLRSGQKRYTDSQKVFFEKELLRCNQELQKLRNEFYHVFDQSWHQLMENGFIAAPQLLAVSEISRKLAHSSRRAADDLFPYCGLEAAKKETEINRVWRDIHTASQHSLLTFE